MKNYRNIYWKRKGFTLIEILAATVIGAMIMIAVLTVYSRAEKTAAGVIHTIDSYRRPYEALQIIAEDLDKMISTNSDTSMVMVNRHINGYAAAVFAIRVEYKDATNKTQQYEEILWQCNQNPEGDANDMVLYRSYDGLTPMDKLLDKNKDESEKNVYVPICDGVTFFQVKTLNGEDEPDIAWPGGMPMGVILTISFAKPYKNVDGYFEVDEKDKYSRTIAIDKSRKIKFDLSNEEESPDSPIRTLLNR